MDSSLPWPSRTSDAARRRRGRRVSTSTTPPEASGQEEQQHRRRPSSTSQSSASALPEGGISSARFPKPRSGLMDGFTIPAGNELGASLIDFADPAPSPNIALPPSHHKTEAQSRQQRQQPAPTCPGVPVKVRQRREAIMSLCKHYAQGIDAKDLEILKALLLEEANSVLGVFLPFEILESKGRIAVAPVGRPWDPDDPESIWRV